MLTRIFKDQIGLDFYSFAHCVICQPCGLNNAYYTWGNLPTMTKDQHVYT